MRSLIYNSQLMYQTYQRQKSRDRSRDRDRRFPGRSPSEDENAQERKERGRFGKGRGKRVKFEGNDDIRVFRKQDEPTAKGLAEEDILKIKAEIEKEIAKSYDFNWEHYKHRDALLESNSMKEQKEREKALSEKLMAARELIPYSYPLKLLKIENIIEPGCESVEKEAHSARIHDILGCYYTHVSEIPNEPAFEILNTHPSPESKAIKFDNDLFPEEPTTQRKPADNSRPLRSILKMPNSDRGPERSRSQPRQIDPQLIYLLKDFKLNPQLYTKEKTEQLLKPYKDSGELDFLMRNKEVLEAMLKNTNAQNKPPIQGQYRKESAERSGSQPAIGHPHTFVPKADKFRTVPCKYYHSPQGCSKIDNCTFIHDEQFKGVPVPSGQGSSSHHQQSRSGYNSQSMHGGYYNPMPNPNYYNPSMGYTAASYPAYSAPYGYPPGYQMGKNPGQYPPAQGNPPQGSYGGAGYAAGYGQQGQGYGTSGQGYGGGQGQGQGQGQGYSGSGQQGYSNPNYQYYIGGNPPK